VLTQGHIAVRNLKQDVEEIYITDNIYIFFFLHQREEIRGHTNNTLDDFWKFNHKNQKWIEIKVCMHYCLCITRIYFIFGT
jgi:hypothetical protein